MKFEVPLEYNTGIGYQWRRSAKKYGDRIEARMSPPLIPPLPLPPFLYLPSPPLPLLPLEVGPVKSS